MTCGASVAEIAFAEPERPYGGMGQCALDFAAARSFGRRYLHRPSKGSTSAVQLSNQSPSYNSHFAELGPRRMDWQQTRSLAPRSNRGMRQHLLEMY